MGGGRGGGRSWMAGVRVGLLQIAAGEDKPANLTAVVEGVEALAEQGAQLVVAPEAVMHGFGTADRPLAPVAEPMDGPFVTGLQDVARRLSGTGLAGMFEPVEGDAARPWWGRVRAGMGEPVEDDDARAYNTVVAVGADGGILGRYRKQHLFDA